MSSDQKFNFRITTLADSWNCNACNRSCAHNSEPTNSEKVAALVDLMRSEWTTEHIGQTYVERLTATDPQLIFVALQGTTPIGTENVQYTVHTINYEEYK